MSTGLVARGPDPSAEGGSVSARRIKDHGGEALNGSSFEQRGYGQPNQGLGSRGNAGGDFPPEQAIYADSIFRE